MAPIGSADNQDLRLQERNRRQELLEQAGAYIAPNRVQQREDAREYGNTAQPSQSETGLAYQPYVDPQRAWNTTFRVNALRNGNNLDDQLNMMTDVRRRSGQGVGSTAYETSMDRFNANRSLTPDMAVSEANKAAQGAEQAAYQRADLAFRQREAARQRAEESRRFGIKHELEGRKTDHGMRMDTANLALNADKLRLDFAMRIKDLEQRKITDAHAMQMAKKQYHMAMTVNMLNAQLQDRELDMKQWVNKVTMMYQAAGIRLDYQKLREASDQAAIGNQLAAQGLILKAAQIKANTEAAERLAKEQQRFQAMTLHQSQQTIEDARRQAQTENEMKEREMMLTADYRSKHLTQTGMLAQANLAQQERFHRENLADVQAGRVFTAEQNLLGREHKESILDRELKAQMDRLNLTESNKNIRFAAEREDTMYRYQDQEARKERMHNEAMEIKRGIDAFNRYVQTQNLNHQRITGIHNRDMDNLRHLLDMKKQAIDEMVAKGDQAYKMGSLSIDAFNAESTRLLNDAHIRHYMSTGDLSWAKFEQSKPKHGFLGQMFGLK
jgi:hypothetical protein